MSWTDYWNEMAMDGIWVNHIFVQVTAWYLGLDIQIVTTSASPESPFIYIYGYINKLDEPAPGPPVLIGNYTNVHYQSLLPFIQESTRQPSKCKIAKGEEKKFHKDYFTYAHGNEHITFPKH